MSEKQNRERAYLVGGVVHLKGVPCWRSGTIFFVRMLFFYSWIALDCAPQKMLNGAGSCSRPAKQNLRKPNQQLNPNLNPKLNQMLVSVVLLLHVGVQVCQCQ
jgi:hypothetical protein